MSSIAWLGGCVNSKDIEAGNYKDINNAKNSHVKAFIDCGKNVDLLDNEEITSILSEVGSDVHSEVYNEINQACERIEESIKEFVDYDSNNESNIYRNLEFIISHFDDMLILNDKEDIFTYLYYRNSSSSYNVFRDIYNKVLDFWEKTDTERLAYNWFQSDEKGRESLVCKKLTQRYEALGTNFIDKAKELGIPLITTGDSVLMP